MDEAREGDVCFYVASQDDLHCRAVVPGRRIEGTTVRERPVREASVLNVWLQIQVLEPCLTNKVKLSSKRLLIYLDAASAAW